jgi:hypothetical protein
MAARYLYEHFFLAHIAFTDADPREFFELVRSTTPPGGAWPQRPAGRTARPAARR